MLIAVKEFRKGQIVCDYHGTLTKLNSKPPPRDNESHVLLFQFDSNWWKINATEEDGSTSVKIGYNRIKIGYNRIKIGINYGNRQSWEGLAFGTFTKLSSKPPPHDNESYVLLFQFDSNWWKIDATEEDGSYGRLINHSRQKANLAHESATNESGKPTVLLKAKRDIQIGEEFFWV